MAGKLQSMGATPTLFKLALPERKGPVRPARARANILRVWNLAHPLERAHGLAWYTQAHKQASKIAEASATSTACACYVIASLSPNTEWNRNARDAKALILEYRRTGEVRTRYACYPANVRKATAILKAHDAEKDFIPILKGQKVEAFASNMLQTSIAGKVTIDAHAYSIASGRRYSVKAMPAISQATYARYSQAYRDVAKDLGILPQQLQAVTWLTWKRIHRV